MRCVWIIDPYCAIPNDEWGYMHALSMSETFERGGYQVLYITANFSHATKRKRGGDWEIIPNGISSNILLLPTRIYSEHIGLKRILWLRDFCQALRVVFKSYGKPSLVYYPAPLIFADWFIARMKKKLRFNLIVDIRDLWPELFVNRFGSKTFRLIIKFIVSPIYISRWVAVKSADAITAPSRGYLDKFYRQRKINKVVYYSPVDIEKFRAAMAAPSVLPITKNINEIWVVLTGSIGSNFDLNGLVEAAAIFKLRNRNVKFIVTGDGSKKRDLLDAVANSGLDNLHYMGVLNYHQLCKVYYYADIGLSAYDRSSTVTMPTKAYEYVSAGLPIVNSLKGEFAKFIDDNRIGFSYAPGNGSDLAECVLRCIADEDVWLILKRNVEKISMLFDKNAQYATYLDIANNFHYDELVN